jgi:site-specific recombinase XerD
MTQTWVPAAGNLGIDACPIAPSDPRHSPFLSTFQTLLQTLSADLDGSAGSNRAVAARSQIAANADIDALKAWLARFAQTKTTFDSYRKEAERLLLWCVIDLRKPLASLTHEDLLAYQRFLADPQPVDRWVMPAGRKRARGDPGWRPFAGPLSPASQRQAIVILNTLFSWLVHAGYLAGNPLSLFRQRQRHAAPRVVRYLDDTMWDEVKTTIAGLPRDTPRDLEHYHRARWLFTLLYLSGMRISEVAHNTMGAFFARRDRAGVTRWWLEILGKGDKLRLVPATTELMDELATYRRALGLSPEPAVGETQPLLAPIGGKARAMTRSALHIIAKQVFARTADRVRARGSEHAHTADILAAASAHWLRHTAGSAMATGDMDLRHVRDNLGHASLTTTSRYLHSDDDARHQATEDGHRLGW